MAATSPRRLHLIMASLLAFSGCGRVVDPDVEPLIPLTVEPWKVQEYALSGSLLVHQVKPYTYHACRDTLSASNTVPARADTFDIRFKGRFLHLKWRIDLPSLDSGATTAITFIYERVLGSGGLEGTWRAHSLEYPITKGTPNDTDKAIFKYHVETFRWETAYKTEDLEFAGGKASYRTLVRATDLFLAEWNGNAPDFPDVFRLPVDWTVPDSAAYDIQVAVEDARTVVLKGRQNAETVRISQSDPMNRLDTYSSSDPSHAPYTTDLRSPLDCSAGEDREWYFDFLAANRKPSE